MATVIVPSTWDALLVIISKGKCDNGSQSLERGPLWRGGGGGTGRGSPWRPARVFLSLAALLGK